MIIFGFKTYATVLAILNFVCPQCGNPAAQRVTKIVRKFSLFFIPLFPVSSKYRTMCTFCGLEQEVSREQAEQMVGAGAQQPMPQQHHPHPQDQPQ